MSNRSLAAAPPRSTHVAVVAEWWRREKSVPTPVGWLPDSRAPSAPEMVRENATPRRSDHSGRSREVKLGPRDRPFRVAGPLAFSVGAAAPASDNPRTAATARTSAARRAGPRVSRRLAWVARAGKRQGVQRRAGVRRGQKWASPMPTRSKSWRHDFEPALMDYFYSGEGDGRRAQSLGCARDASARSVPARGAVAMDVSLATDRRDQSSRQSRQLQALRNQTRAPRQCPRT